VSQRYSFENAALELQCRYLVAGWFKQNTVYFDGAIRALAHEGWCGTKCSET